MSGHGIPPPPPPRRFPNAASSSSAGRKNDVGSLCPPPLQAQASPFHIAGSQQQPMHHPQNPASYQMYQQYPGYSYGNVQYQQVQQPVHSGYQYTPQNQHYYAYPNYASAPPPPPPPPRNPPTSNNNINIDNIAIPASTKSDSPSPHRATQGDKPKKLNPKMAQKYSGQGLKTITISGPGLRPQKFKICVGNHPDDIKKWIEERKKNFPRTSCRQKGVNNRSGDVKQHQTETKRNRGGDVDTNESDDPTKQHNESGENAASLSNLLAGYGSSSSTSDDESTSKKDKSFDLASVETTAAAKAASEKVSEDTNTSIQSRPKRICKYFQRGKCHHGDSCKFLHSNEASSATRSDQRKRKRQAQSDRDKARNDHEYELQILGLANPSHGSNLGGKTMTNTSLLHKLLQRDKERERRLTLQLLRYIVDCDYFQSEKSIDVQA
ncbi:hypothetical protein ACHAWT_010963 [Skeletonema menzelii]